MPLLRKRFCEHMESSLHLPTELSNTGTQGVLFPSVHHRLVPPPTSGLPCLSVRRLPSIPEDGLVHPRRDSQDVEATIKDEAAHCFEFTRRLRNSQRYAQASLIPRLSLINSPCIDCGKDPGRRHDLALYNGGLCNVHGPPKSVVCAPDNEILFNEIDIRVHAAQSISLAQSQGGASGPCTFYRRVNRKWA